MAKCSTTSWRKPQLVLVPRFHLWRSRISGEITVECANLASDELTTERPTEQPTFTSSQPLRGGGVECGTKCRFGLRMRSAPVSWFAGGGVVKPA
jgi:hypothetical protein